MTEASGIEILVMCQFWDDNLRQVAEEEERRLKHDTRF